MLDPGQQRHVAAPDRRARGVLDSEHDPDRALDALGLARGPAVAGGVLADELAERRLQGRVGRRREPQPQPGAQVTRPVQQDQLAVGHRAQQAHVRRGGPLHVRPLALPFLVEHAADGEEQLLAGLGHVSQADPADPDAVAGGEQAALLAAQAAGAVPADRDHPLARRARPGRVGVPPRLASRAQPPVGAGHAPPAAVPAGADHDRRARGLPGGRSLAGGAGVAAGAQPGGVVVLPRAAPAARRRGDRPAGPAVKAARDLPHRRGPRPADLAHAHRAGHAGGTDRCRPSTGVTGAGEPAWALAGRRAATLSGSRISRSDGCAVEHGADHVQVIEPDRDRVADPQRGHLPGADLQPGLGEQAAHRGGFPDAPLGRLHPQVPAHRLTFLPAARAGPPSVRWPPPTHARCGRNVHVCTGLWWKARNGRGAPGPP